jgi:iron transport multicopper oxidase
MACDLNYVRLSP